ncbi:MAG: YihY/virulence factor BrkB family protein [Bacteroidaceae bacterium]|nr:YihY/virulence factor BrkB family protein [Bacteroidaceae bacterium]
MSKCSPRRWLQFLRQLFVGTCRLFFEEDMGAGAKALTYSTLMGVVPFLAILFAIAKGFGLQDFIEGRVRTAFPTDPETVDTLMGFVGNYLDNTKSGVFIGVGIVILLWSLLTLTDSIEGTFNKIWQVKHDRSLSRKLTDYTAMVFLLPVLVFVSMGFSVFLSTSVENLPDVLLLRPGARVLAELIGYVVLTFTFVMLYIFLPNTKVNLGSALLASVFTAVVFDLWQDAYIEVQKLLTSYNTIYGSFAAIPLFMLWCLVSWYIILFGATMTSVCQNDVSLTGDTAAHHTRRGFNYLCVMTAAIVCRRFVDKQTVPNAKAVARELHLSVRAVNRVFDRLRGAALVHETTGERHTGFVPSGDVHAYTVGYVLDALDGSGEDFKQPQWKQLQDYLAAARDEGFAKTKLIDL